MGPKAEGSLRGGGAAAGAGGAAFASGAGGRTVCSSCWNCSGDSVAIFVALVAVVDVDSGVPSWVR